MSSTSGHESAAARTQPQAAVQTRRVVALAVLAPALALLAALALTWLLAGQPWSAVAQVGQRDSALLGPGFYTKEQTADGVPFRWTNGPAVLRVPYLRSSYIVAIRADTATGQPYTVKLLDNDRRWATFTAQPGFRTYHVLWPAALAKHWMAGLGAHDFTILAEARQLPGRDSRLYGIAISELAARELGGELPIAPLLVVGFAICALVFLLHPFSRTRHWALAAVALLLPIAYNLLAWNPPVGDDHTWLPVAWLPWLIALALTGLALAKLAGQGRRGALLASVLVGGLFVVLLLSLNTAWRVEGPDYGWHLNHGGSWDRVFRAHRFYPFGFPLVLYLGQLAGDHALLFGRVAGALATLATFGATGALVWRIVGPRLAWVGGALLLGAPMVIAYGVLASTDAPMAGAAALALLALCWHATPGWRQALTGGLLLGLAYLFRFQALVLLAPAALWLLLQPRAVLPRRLGWLARTGRLALPLLCVGGFVLATTPQWVFDIRDFGRPFFTQQYMNIWTFAFDQQRDVPAGTPLQEIWYIISYDPAMLWRHWMATVEQAGSETLHQALVWPFGLLALVGAVGALLGLRDRRYALLALWVVVYVATVALTYNKDRFYLPIMPALIVFAVAVLHQLAERFANAGRWRTVFVTCAAVSIWCWALLHLLDAERELIVYIIS